MADEKPSGSTSSIVVICVIERLSVIEASHGRKAALFVARALSRVAVASATSVRQACCPFAVIGHEHLIERHGFKHVEADTRG